MKQAILLLNLALASCLFIASTDGATITWKSGVSGNWSNPANWKPGQVPGASDTAAITASGSYTVTVDTNVTVGSLILGTGGATTQTVLLNGQSLAIGQSATVNTNGVIDLSSGTLNFDQNGGSIMKGTLACSSGTLGGVLTIASNGVANLGGSSAGTQTVDFASLILTNYGTIVWSNIDLDCTTNSQIFNYNLFSIQFDNTFTGGSLSAFNNFGTVRKIGTYSSTNYVTRFDSVTFNNSGTVDVEMGAITFSSGDGGGRFNTATNAGLGLGNFTLTGDATFTGPGAVQGTLYGQDGVIHGSMAFDYGSFAGTLTVATDGVVNLVGINGETTPIGLSDLILTNYGTVVWSNLDIECQTNIAVDNYGLWDAQTNNSFYGATSRNGPVFNNYGIVRKDGGSWNLESPVTLFSSTVTFNNAGTIDVESGGINLSIGSGGGSFNTATNAGLSLGDFTLSGDATFTGAGAIQGTLYSHNAVIHGSMMFDYGSFGGALTVATDGVVNLVGINGETTPIGLNDLILTNYGTVVWSNLNIECQSTSVIDNYGLWDIQTNNSFYGASSADLTVFNNYGTVRKDGGSWTVEVLSPVTLFDSTVTFNNFGTIDVETGGISLATGNGGGLFNTATNAGILFGNFKLDGDSTFTGAGQVQGTLSSFNSVINGSLNLSAGGLSGTVTIASNSVVNLLWRGDLQPVSLNGITMTNYGTVIWGNFDLDGNGTQIYNYGLWDAQSDNTFYGSSSGLVSSTFNNYGTVRKDGGSTITTFDIYTTFNNYGTVDVETAQINLNNGTGGGVFNTASNAIVWLGVPYNFGLSSDVTFTGPGLVGGNLIGDGASGGLIHGSLNFYYGSLGGPLTIASNAVANLVGLAGPTQPISLKGLTLTNCGTVTWNNIDLDGSGTQIYNRGLWDALSDNTFYGVSGGGAGSTFNNYGTVRKDGGMTITHFDIYTTFNNSGTVDVETAQINLDAGAGGGMFNTASNAIVWLGLPYNFDLSGNVTFKGPGWVGGNLLGYPDGGVINGSLNFYFGSLGGALTVASNAVANLVGLAGPTPQPISLNGLTLTNCGTVTWHNIDLDGSGTQIYNLGLWDALSDNTFYGISSGGVGSTFNNYGTVRKDGGMTITHFDIYTTFNNSGTVDVETAQINLDNGAGGGLFNTASNAIVWLGGPYNFDLSGNVTFTGPGWVGGNLLGYPDVGVINGSLNFYFGSLGGALTVASNAVANLVGLAGPTPQPISLNGLTLTNCGTVTWNNIDLDGSGTQIYNLGLWDALSDNTFYGISSGGVGSTFNNFGTVRKDGGMTITHFDIYTAFNNSGTVDVETAQINIDAGTGGGLFNTASNAIVWLGGPYNFDLSGNVTFSGPGLVGGNLLGYPDGGVIHGSLNFYYGSLLGALTVASNAVANLVGLAGPIQPISLNGLTLTNCGTVTWSNIDLDGSGTQIYNHGLWDVLSDNTFYGISGGGVGSTFNNCGTVRKDGGSAITTFDNATTFNNPGKTDVQIGQVTLAGSCSLTNGTLNVGIWSPSQSGVVDFPNSVPLAGRLSANFRNHYTPVVSNSYPVVVYGSETGMFTSTCLPTLSSGLFWQTNYSSTAFTLNVVSSPPLQLLAGLSADGKSMALSWDGLSGQTYQVQCTTNLAPAIWTNLGDPIAGTNGPITVLDSLSASPQKYYRIQSQ